MWYIELFILLLCSFAIYGQDLIVPTVLLSELQQDGPPQVSIIQPFNGSVFDGRQIRVDYVVSGAVLKSVKILVDDKAVQLLTDVKIGQNAVIVDVPDHDCKISIVAQNDFGANDPAVVNLKRRREHIVKSTLYILAIGISNYSNTDIRLQFPAKDATDFSQSMLRQEGLLYEKVEIRLLTNSKANAENIRDGLYWLQTETTSRDVAMLYMAGHGVNNNIGDFFFMPVNADIDRINASCVGYSEIKGAISVIAGKAIVFMDACHSGNVLGNNQRRTAVINQAVNDLAETDNGTIVFTSSTGRQFSLENPDWNNGAFTKALVEGLNGKADMFNRKVITVKNLDLYITNRVKELTKGQQAPTTIIPSSIPDFPIAIVPDHESLTETPNPEKSKSGIFSTKAPIARKEENPGYDNSRPGRRKEITTQSEKDFSRFYVGLAGGGPVVALGLNAAYFINRHVGIGVTGHAIKGVDSWSQFLGPAFYGHWGRRASKFFFPTNIGLGYYNFVYDGYEFGHENPGFFVSVGAAYRLTKLISFGLNGVIASDFGLEYGMPAVTLGVNFHF